MFWALEQREEGTLLLHGEQLPVRGRDKSDFEIAALERERLDMIGNLV